MKSLMNYIAAGGMFLALASPLSAEESSANKITRLVQSETVTGSLLWDYHGNKLGRITDVMLEPFSNNIFVVVDTDGLLEEDRKVVVPWKKLYVKSNNDDADEIVFTLDADKKKMDGAPLWEKGSENNLIDRNKVWPVFKYWDLDIDVERKQATRD